MLAHRSWIHSANEPDEAAANRQTASLAGLALVLGLIVVGLFLVGSLHNYSRLDDCVLSGSRSCEMLPTDHK